jgi:hypothetical protein
MCLLILLIEFSARRVYCGWLVEIGETFEAKNDAVKFKKKMGAKTLITASKLPNKKKSCSNLRHRATNTWKQNSLAERNPRARARMISFVISIGRNLSNPLLPTSITDIR